MPDNLNNASASTATDTKVTTNTKATLDALIAKTSAVESKPIFFDLNKSEDATRLDALMASGAVAHVVDDYEEEQLELFGVKNPTLVYTPTYKATFKDFFDKLTVSSGGLHKHGLWVYVPWLSLLSHILPEDDFQLVRTARNKNLINASEQDKFYNATVGIAGLSVGSSVAFALVLQGGAKHVKLADMDRLALSNTNRVLSGVHNLGVLKVEMAARTIYTMNPYATVELYPQGLTPESIPSFFDGLDIVIDELDNLAVKYLIREQAKAHKIAVVMAADNGDNAVVDIERYDVTPDMPYFHGRMGEVNYDMLSKLDKFGIGKMITRHVGAENVTVRMQESLVEMGKTIVSWPQLGGAALVNGAAVAYCVRKILNGQELEPNRTLINLDSMLTPSYNTPQEQQKRVEIAERFKKGFGL